jgi:hypothetical protein
VFFFRRKPCTEEKKKNEAARGGKNLQEAHEYGAADDAYFAGKRLFNSRYRSARIANTTKGAVYST